MNFLVYLKSLICGLPMSVGLCAVGKFMSLIYNLFWFMWLMQWWSKGVGGEGGGPSLPSTQWCDEIKHVGMDHESRMDNKETTTKP